MRPTISASRLGRPSSSASAQLQLLTASAAQVRQLSSSSTRSFFFRRPTGPAPHKIVSELLSARHQDRLDLVAKLYPSLLASLASVPPDTPPPISQHQFRQLLRFVAGTPRFSLVLKMFNSLEPVFGYRPGGPEHHLLLRGMASAGKLGKALSWIEGMEKTHGVVPDVVDWNVVLGGYRRARDLDGLRFAWARMVASGLRPNVASYNALISALFEHGDVQQVKQAVQEMQRYGVDLDIWTDTALLTGFIDAGELASATPVAARLRRVVDRWDPHAASSSKAGSSSPSQVDLAALNALLQYEAASSGAFAGALRLAEQYRAKGHPLNTRTVNTLAVPGAVGLASAAEAVELVEVLEQTTGQRADRRTWTIALKGVLAGPGGLTQALAVHQEARDRSVLPDSLMVQPLLSALLLPSPTPENMELAKQLYEDLATAAKTYAVAPDAEVYVALLRACADPAHPDIAFSATLLADMHERGIRLDPAAATWHIVALMRAAGTFDNAFRAYDALRALDVAALDHHAYNTILAAFTSLPSAVPAPPPLVLEFLGDMRRASHPPSGATYSLLLRYYSRQFRSAKSVAQLHALIKLDLNLDPDTALFNSLMEAYSRVGAFNSAYRIWDAMRANPSGGAGIDDQSVSIFLDTCGHEGGPTGLARARKVWRELREERYPRNLKHWDSLLECLVRCGEIDEASEVALGRLAPPTGVEGVVAGRATLETLLKLSRQWEGKWDELRARIEVERPDLWPELKHVAGRVDDPNAPDAVQAAT